MSIPLFFPAVEYVPHLKVSARAMTLRALCEAAGVLCKASGAWTDRVVDLAFADDVKIVAGPGDWSAVRICSPIIDRRLAARLGLAVMAYSLHDLVARQSIIGAPWARISAPRGRIARGVALSTAERQRRFRARRRKPN